VPNAPAARKRRLFLRIGEESPSVLFFNTNVDRCHDSDAPRQAAAAPMALVNDAVDYADAPADGPARAVSGAVVGSADRQRAALVHVFERRVLSTSVFAVNYGVDDGCDSKTRFVNAHAD
jgi:hypothetical protein